MSYKIEVTKRFKKEFKRLSKRYSSIKKEFDELLDSIEVNPFEGKPIGGSFYKIRLGIASKGKGKRGGARVITYVVTIEEVVYITTIYDKSEKENVTQKELEEILKNLK